MDAITYIPNHPNSPSAHTNLVSVSICSELKGLLKVRPPRQESSVPRKAPSSSPTDEVELGMFEEICAARWRRRRAWSIETRRFDFMAAAPPLNDASHSDLPNEPSPISEHSHFGNACFSLHQPSPAALLAPEVGQASWPVASRCQVAARNVSTPDPRLPAPVRVPFY
jgi:hypothetical protein